MATQITVNGELVVLDEPASVQDVVARTLSGAAEASDGRGIAVAVNGEVVPRGSWDTTTVRPRDEIEILTATQGG